MGSYLRLRVQPPAQAEAANEFLRQQPEYEVLEECDRTFLFVTEDRIATVEEELGDYPDFHEDLGVTSIKVSGVSLQIAEEYHPRAKWASLIGKLHEHEAFDIELVRGLNPHEEGTHIGVLEQYFTPDQIQTITNSCEAVPEDQRQAVYRAMGDPRAEDVPLEEAAEKLLYDGPVGETLHQTAANLVDEFIQATYDSAVAPDQDTRDRLVSAMVDGSWEGLESLTETAEVSELYIVFDTTDRVIVNVFTDEEAAWNWCDDLERVGDSVRGPFKAYSTIEAFEAEAGAEAFRKPIPSE